MADGGRPADGRRPADSGSPLAPFLDLDRGHIRFSVRPPPEPGPLAHVDGLLAGAAEADLTPPPGMPKAGYSRLAHTGSGFRTRLRARVVHLRAGRTSLALVACDLHVGSAVLQHLVSRAVAEDTDVGLAGLFIGVTHTHGGPGGFHDSQFYAHWSADRPGFDPAYTHFLVERIAGAVIAAVGSRRPARLAAGSDQVWGVSRNRAHAPHVRNHTVADKRTDPQRKWVGVNPWLHLLRIDTEEAGGAVRPLAAWVTYSIHGVAVSEQTPDYNGDLWPHLCDELAGRVAASHGSRPIVAAAQGTHGDVTPAVRPGLKTHPEAERLGRRIGAAAADVYRDLDGE
ncbi:MAG: neutral/alkaline non-lysosomal ceramidase N-terminal domain-containing protein, partial [Acidimicrobiales bacterium]